MGKLEKIVARLDNGVAIEINDGGDGNKIVHVQSDAWRMELTPDEYREICAAIISAALHLRWRKGQTWT